jgi:hypothetical protein
LWDEIQTSGYFLLGRFYQSQEFIFKKRALRVQEYYLRYQFLIVLGDMKNVYNTVNRVISFEITSAISLTLVTTAPLFQLMLRLLL